MNAGVLKSLRDDCAMDSEMGGQLIHRVTRLVALDEVSHLLGVEPLGPLRCSGSAPLGRSGQVQPPICMDRSPQR